jgi:hypothetical protein
MNISQNYKEGILKDVPCELNTSLNRSLSNTHSILAVGWGRDPHFGDFVILHNSWD